MFFQEKCLNRINALIEEHGTTVLFVSHDINQVERLCKKALWLEKGVVKMIGDVKEVCDAYRTSQA
jgi:ABC-type polysaccharide/polyol phosphate transport system ATPase subunit